MASKIRLPKSEALRAVIAVCECGNFTEAAKELGISKPWVSKSVSEAEKLLGRRLFDRSTRMVVQRPDAVHLFEAIRAVIAAEEALLAAANENGEEQKVARWVSVMPNAVVAGGLSGLARHIDVCSTAIPPNRPTVVATLQFLTTEGHLTLGEVKKIVEESLVDCKSLLRMIRQRKITTQDIVTDQLPDAVASQLWNLTNRQCLAANIAAKLRRKRDAIISS